MVDAGKVEHKVTVRVIGVQLRRRAVQVVAVGVVYVEIGARAILAVADVFQIVHKGGAHYALGAGSEDVHGKPLTFSKYILFLGSFFGESFYKQVVVFSTGAFSRQLHRWEYLLFG